MNFITLNIKTNDNRTHRMQLRNYELYGFVQDMGVAPFNVYESQNSEVKRIFDAILDKATEINGMRIQLIETYLPDEKYIKTVGDTYVALWYAVYYRKFVEAGVVEKYDTSKSLAKNVESMASRHSKLFFHKK